MCKIIFCDTFFKVLHILRYFFKSITYFAILFLKVLYIENEKGNFMERLGKENRK